MLLFPARVCKAFSRSLALAAALVFARASAQDLTPVIHVANPPNAVAQQAKHYVVLVSLDGFRYDYGRLYGTPHLDEMAKAGASTPEGMRPSYPSVTFPNHYTLVTGLRPEHHGIVGMDFYDRARGASYVFNDDKANTDGSWYSGVPLWSLAEQQGMRAASFFWPGSEAEIAGKRPTFYLHYDEKLGDDTRIDQVIAWLKLPPAERPHFITLYYPNVDHDGHNFGPNTPQTRDAVHHLDAMIGELREKLHATGLPVDLIVTADHGMSAYQGEPVVLDSFADLSHVRTNGTMLYADTPEAAEKLYREFRAHPDLRFTAYRRKDVPKHLHFRDNVREGDPVIVANGPYALYAHAPKKPGHPGGHGFDPERFPEMKAIFYAEGPDIAPGVRLKTFENTSVFPLITHLLGLNSPAVDGSVKPLKALLQQAGRTAAETR